MEESNKYLLSLLSGSTCSPTHEWWTNCTEQGFPDWPQNTVSDEAEKGKEYDEMNVRHLTECVPQGLLQHPTVSGNEPEKIHTCMAQKCEEEFGEIWLQEAMETDKVLCCKDSSRGGDKGEEENQMEEAYAVLAESCEFLVDMDDGVADQKPFKMPLNLDVNSSFLGLGEGYNARVLSRDEDKACREVLDGSHAETLLQDNGTAWESGAVSMLTLDVCLELDELSAVTQVSQENSNCEKISEPGMASWLNNSVTTPLAVRPMEWFGCESGQSSFEHCGNECRWIRGNRSFGNCVEKGQSRCSVDTFIPITPTISTSPLRSWALMNNEDQCEEQEETRTMTRKPCRSPSDSDTMFMSHTRGSPHFSRTFDDLSKEVVSSEEDGESHELVMEILEDEAEALGLSPAPISSGFIPSSGLGFWQRTKTTITDQNIASGLDGDETFGCVSDGPPFYFSEKRRGGTQSVEPGRTSNQVFSVGQMATRMGSEVKENHEINISEGILPGAVSFLRKASRKLSRSSDSRVAIAKNSGQSEHLSRTKAAETEVLLPSRRSQRLRIKRSYGRATFRSSQRELGDTEPKRRHKDEDVHQDKERLHVMDVRSARLSNNVDVANDSTCPNGVSASIETVAGGKPTLEEKSLGNFRKLGVNGYAIEDRGNFQSIVDKCGASDVQSPEIRCDEVLSGAGEHDDQLRNFDFSDTDATSIQQLALALSSSCSAEDDIRMDDLHCYEKDEAPEFEKAVSSDQFGKELHESAAGRTEEPMLLQSEVFGEGHANESPPCMVSSPSHLVLETAEMGSETDEYKTGEPVLVQKIFSNTPVSDTMPLALILQRDSSSLAPEMSNEPQEIQTEVLLPIEANFTRSNENNGESTSLAVKAVVERNEPGNECPLVLLDKEVGVLQEQDRMTSTPGDFDKSWRSSIVDGSARTRGDVMRKAVDRKEEESRGVTIGEWEDKQILRKGRCVTPYFAPGWGGRKPAKDSRLSSSKSACQIEQKLNVELSYPSSLDLLNNRVETGIVATFDDPSSGGSKGYMVVGDTCNSNELGEDSQRSQVGSNPGPAPESRNMVEGGNLTGLDKADGESSKEGEGATNNWKLSEETEHNEDQGGLESSEVQAVKSSSQNRRLPIRLMESSEEKALLHSLSSSQKVLNDSSQVQAPSAELVSGSLALNNISAPVKSSPILNDSKTSSSGAISEQMKSPSIVNNSKTISPLGSSNNCVVRNQIAPTVSVTATNVPVMRVYERRSLSRNLDLKSSNRDPQAGRPIQGSTVSDEAGEKLEVQKAKQWEKGKGQESLNTLGGSVAVMSGSQSQAFQPAVSSNDSPVMRTRIGARERKRPQRFSVDGTECRSRVSSKVEKARG